MMRLEAAGNFNPKVNRDSNPLASLAIGLASIMPIDPAHISEPATQGGNPVAREEPANLNSTKGYIYRLLLIKKIRAALEELQSGIDAYLNGLKLLQSNPHDLISNTHTYDHTREALDQIQSYSRDLKEALDSNKAEILPISLDDIRELYSRSLGQSLISWHHLRSTERQFQLSFVASKEAQEGMKDLRHQLDQISRQRTNTINLVESMVNHPMFGGIEARLLLDHWADLEFVIGSDLRDCSDEFELVERTLRSDSEAFTRALTNIELLKESASRFQQQRIEAGAHFPTSLSTIPSNPSPNEISSGFPANNRSRMQHIQDWRGDASRDLANREPKLQFASPETLNPEEREHRDTHLSALGSEASWSSYWITDNAFNRKEILAGVAESPLPEPRRKQLQGSRWGIASEEHSPVEPAQRFTKQSSSSKQDQTSQGSAKDGEGSSMTPQQYPDSINRLKGSSSPSIDLDTENKPREPFKKTIRSTLSPRQKEECYAAYLELLHNYPELAPQNGAKLNSLDDWCRQNVATQKVIP